MDDRGIYAVAFLAIRSVWLRFSLHLYLNMSQGLFGLPISVHIIPGFLASTSVGDPLWNGGAYGPEAGIPGMLARLVVIALLFIYLHRRYPRGSIRTLRFAPEPVRRSSRTTR